MNQAIKLLIEVMSEIDEAAGAPSYDDRIELDPKTTKKFLKRFEHLRKSGGFANPVLVVQTQGHMQNEQEKRLAFEREDAMRLRLIAAMAFIQRQFCHLVTNRETGPEGEACSACGEFVGNWGDPKMHLQDCPVRALL